jgi:hypothetical protein
MEYRIAPITACCGDRTKVRPFFHRFKREMSGSW